MITVVAERGCNKVELIIVPARFLQKARLEFVVKNNKMAEALKLHIKRFDGTSFSTWLNRIKSTLNDNECLEAVESTSFASIAENKKLEASAKNIIVCGIADSYLYT